MAKSGLVIPRHHLDVMITNRIYTVLYYTLSKVRKIIILSVEFFVQKLDKLKDRHDLDGCFYYKLAC